MSNYQQTQTTNVKREAKNDTKVFRDFKIEIKEEKY